MQLQELNRVLNFCYRHYCVLYFQKSAKQSMPLLFTRIETLMICFVLFCFAHHTHTHTYSKLLLCTLPIPHRFHLGSLSPHHTGSCLKCISSVLCRGTDYPGMKKLKHRTLVDKQCLCDYTDRKQRQLVHKPPPL